MILALDIGGTKIDVCRIDVRETVTMATPLARIATAVLKPGSKVFLENLCAVARQYWCKDDKAIAFSINCLVHDGNVLASSVLGVRGSLPLAERLTCEFRLPCVIENDVVAMAIAEAECGVGKKCRNFTLVNIGTGLRVIHVEDGRPLRGWRNQAGEISDLWKPEGTARDMIDGIVSGRGIAWLYEQETGEQRTAVEICILARGRTDPRARIVVWKFADALADLLVAVSCFYNPEHIVLTGSVTQSHDLFLRRSNNRCRRRLLPQQWYRLRPIISKLEHAACRGVARLAENTINKGAL